MSFSKNLPASEESFILPRAVSLHTLIRHALQCYFSISTFDQKHPDGLFLALPDIASMQQKRIFMSIVQAVFMASQKSFAPCGWRHGSSSKPFNSLLNNGSNYLLYQT